MEKQFTDSILFRIVGVVLLLLCWLDMPYFYFQLIRWVFMGYFVLLAMLHSSREEQNWMVFWAASAILINPIFKIPLGRALWNIVDLVWAGLLLISFFMSREKKE